MTRARRQGRKSPNLRRIVRVLLALGLGTHLAGVALSASAQPAAPAGAQTVQYETSAAGFVIQVPAAGVTVKEQPGQVLLTFSGGVPELNAQDLARRARPWLTGVNVGYDALLLLVAPSARAKVETADGVLRITLVRAAPAPGTETAGDQGAHRLALLDAQLQLRNGHLAEARRQFKALRAEQPQDPDPVSGLASVEREAGRWREALALAREAAQLSGEQQSYVDAVSAIEAEQASRVSVEGGHLRVSGGDYTQAVSEDLIRASGFKRLGEGWRLGAAAATVDVSSGLLQRSDGTVGPFSGRRNQVELDVQNDRMNGVVTTASLFDSRDRVGAAVAFRIPDDCGASRFGVDLRRPYWDLVEGMVDGGMRNRVWLGRAQRLAEQMRGQLDVGFNRYDELIQSNVATSISVAGELRQDNLAKVPGLVASYHLDAEYVRSRATLTGPGGAPYSPLPLQDREVHSLTLGYVRTALWQQSGARLTFDGYGGYAVDRFDSSGPVVAATVKYAIRHFELQLRGSQLRGVGQQGAVNRAVNATATFIF